MGKEKQIDAIGYKQSMEDLHNLHLVTDNNGKVIDTADHTKAMEKAAAKQREHLKPTFEPVLMGVEQQGFIQIPIKEWEETQAILAASKNNSTMPEQEKEMWLELMHKDSKIQIVQSTKKQTYEEWLAEQKEKKALSKEERAKEILKKTRFIQVSLGEWEKMKKTLEETKKIFAVSQEENERLKKAKCALLVTDGIHLPAIFSSVTEEVVKKVVDVNDGLRDHIQNLEVQNSNLAKAYENANNQYVEVLGEKHRSNIKNYDIIHKLERKLNLYIGFSILGGGIFLYNIAKILFGS